MNALRSYVREIMLLEKVGQDPFALRSVTATKTFDTSESQSELIKGAFSGAGSLLKAGKLLVTSKNGGGGISRAAAVAKGNWKSAGVLGLIVGGVALGLGKGAKPDDVDAEERNQAAQNLDEFHGKLVATIERARQTASVPGGLIYQLRCPSIRDPSKIPDTTSRADDFVAHYNKVAKSIQGSTDYNSFFAQMKAYGGNYADLQGEIDRVISGHIPQSAAGDSSKSRSLADAYRQWAHAVLVLDTTHESLSPAINADLADYERMSEYKDLNYSDQSDTTTKLENAITQVGSTVEDSKAYIDSRKVLKDAGYLEGE